MRKKSILIIFILVFLLFIIGLIISKMYLRNNIDYQLDNLVNGNIEQKLIASDILGEKKAILAIPFLIENIDNMNSSTYINSHKAPETLSCSATFALENITEIKLGNTCNIDGKLNEIEIKTVMKAWHNWYDTEYPKWLETQSKIDKLINQ